VPKACIGAVISGSLTTEASAGLPAILSTAVAVVVTPTVHHNADGTVPLDTRK